MLHAHPGTSEVKQLTGLPAATSPLNRTHGIGENIATPVKARWQMLYDTGSCQVKLLALLITLMLSLLSVTQGAAAQSTQTASLPDHVIEKFGLPPEVPSGSLDEDLQEAVTAVFVDSLANSVWDQEQIDGLTRIACLLYTSPSPRD